MARRAIALSERKFWKGKGKKWSSTLLARPDAIREGGEDAIPREKTLGEKMARMVSWKGLERGRYA